jgi:hypothetical protein
MAPVLAGISDSPSSSDGRGGVHRRRRDPRLADHAPPAPGRREEFMPWLLEVYPDLVPRYEEDVHAGVRAGRPIGRRSGRASRGSSARSAGLRPSASSTNERFRRKTFEETRDAAGREDPGTQLTLV